MRAILFAAIAALSFGFPAFGLDVPPQFRKQWKAMKPGTRDYVQFTATRKYVAACKANPNDPPFMPKAFDYKYTTDAEQDLITGAVVTYASLHPNGVPKEQADADPPPPPPPALKSAEGAEVSDLGFTIPEALKKKWKALKPGSKAYDVFVETRKYVAACKANPDDPPNMPKAFNWAYAASDEQDLITNAVITYAALHPTAPTK